MIYTGIQRLIDEHPSVKQGRALGLFGCIDTVGNIFVCELRLLTNHLQVHTYAPTNQPSNGNLGPQVDTTGRLSQQLQGPMTADNAAFKKALRDKGVLGLLRLPLMHIAPPLVITEEELRDGFARVGKVLDESLDTQFK